MQYWKTHQKDLILKKFDKVMKTKNDLTVWQQFGGHRKTYTGSLEVASKEMCRIKISDENHEFDSSSPFFAHIPSQDIIFKKEKYSTIGKLLEFSMPGDIQLYEKRKTKRFYYLYQDHKTVSYHSEEKDPSTQKPVHSGDCVLVDISISGVGLVVSEEFANRYTIDQDLFITNITDQKLPEPFRVKVKYLEPYKNKEKGLYKVGIIFDDKLDSISYKSISNIVEIKQKKVEGLNPKLYCGLDFEEQVRVLNTIEASNKALANNIRDNIEVLDKLRYMTTNMKVGFLQNVSHDLLAVALRLSSKELIYELFSELTTTMQEEMLEKMQAEKPASGVCKAQDEILKVIREMEANGSIMLDPTAFITYV